MARIRGRAKAVFDDARERMDAALTRLDDLRARTLVAEAEWRAYGTAYYALERSLGTSSKQKTAPKSVTAKKSSGKKRAATTPAPSADLNAHCQKEFPGGIVCDEPVDANVHQLRGATGYHEFVAVAQPVAGNGVESEGDAKAATAGAGIQTADIGPLP